MKIFDNVEASQIKITTFNLLGLGGGKPGIKPCWACCALFEAVGWAGGWCWIVWFISLSTSIADPTAAAAAAAAVPPPPTVYSSLTSLPPGPTPTPDCKVKPDRSVKNGSVRGKPTHSIKTPRRPQQSMMFFSLVFCLLTPGAQFTFISLDNYDWKR